MSTDEYQYQQLPELYDVSYVNGYEDEQLKVYKFNSPSDVYDIISYFLEIKSSNDHFYIVDIKKILEKYNLWMKELPFILPFYAIKSNPDPMILKLLSSMGCGFDCASKSEIIEAISYVDHDKIIYANPCKEITQIQFARQKKVDLLTFDSEAELHKIKIHHPKAKLVMRLKVDDSGSVCQFSTKFGCDPDEAKTLLNLINVLELNLVGVSFHIGSNCGKPGYYKKALENARKVFDMAKADFGFELNLLDIGGGFPGYDSQTQLEFSQIASEIRESVDTIFGDIKDKVTFIAEPGRFFCTTSHTLVCNIIGLKKKVNKKTGEKQYQYTINEGLYGSFSAIKFDYANPNIKPFSGRDQTDLYPSIIFGPTCDSLDKLSENAMLPEMTIGDWCFVENFGAYTRASSTNFNGFTPGKVYYVLID
uniref:ornithine decarboxylase n=1 Tax=viral metagenome TaxID=1070528 RepID=A0A6C0E601_9ZZZZ